MRDPAKRLEAHRRYNASAKGRARNKRYEDKHPERAQRIRTGFIAQDAARIARRDAVYAEIQRRDQETANA